MFALRKMATQKDKRPFIIITSAGIASIVLYFGVLFLQTALIYIPGDPWITQVRHWLIDIGIPASFVYKYISFALLHVPMWLLLFPTMFYLGVLPQVWTKSAAIVLALWVPIIDFFGSTMLYVFGFLPEEIGGVLLQVLFGFNTRVVPMVCGILVCLTGFCLGRYIRAFLKRSNTNTR